MSYIFILALIIFFFYCIRYLLKNVPTNNSITKNESINVNCKPNHNPSIFNNDYCSIPLKGIYYNQTTSKLEFIDGEQLYLVREKGNIHDFNAVKVINKNGKKVGYVPSNHSQEFSKLIDDKYNFRVFVKILVERPERTIAYLDITRSKQSDFVDLSLEDVADLDAKGIKLTDEISSKTKLAFDLTQKALQLEKDGNLNDSISLFHEAINLPSPPPVAFNRLAIHYRKVKNYQSEIDVLNKKIAYLIDLNCDVLIKQDSIREVNLRKEKAQSLLLKQNS